ncbi:hypothetical protein HPB52_020367 [Rhipicephalus sanguineus]|uniref:Uncharacterized protein n=1 Tax=Rhipicephalus sanguineus TaxID=34632 RepID=A0A9D4YQV1_RHISA|nr:hypothetical protein HPB52_020367 [Rhipicephalus sanguineus]
MWNDEICFLLLPTRISGSPRCCHGRWYSCRGPLCGFDLRALQSSIRFIQVSLDASGPTLAYVPGKYPCLKMPPVLSTNLTFNILVFQKGVKDSSMDEQKQWELLDNESKAVQRPALQTIQTNDPRCAQAVASHCWSNRAVQARVKVSQPNHTLKNTWSSRTVETGASQPCWDSFHPTSPCPGQPFPCHLCLGWPVPWHPGAQASLPRSGPPKSTILSPNREAVLWTHFHAG